VQLAAHRGTTHRSLQAACVVRPWQGGRHLSGQLDVVLGCEQYIFQCLDASLVLYPKEAAKAFV
jgi:hypothetical protein